MIDSQNPTANTPPQVRVRFAPSPSGFLHVGGARTALFNYLFAKKRNGKFIVRIDDTDLSRSSDDSIRSILTDLAWLGLNWDHGLDATTLLPTDAQGPYRASQRKDIYAKHAQSLIDQNLAYVFTDTDGTQVIKFKAPHPDQDHVFYDDIKGKSTLPRDKIDDFVIIRSNGMATYNFATVVDDHLMGITHVYRADEHLINTFKQILIFNAFAWDIPKYGHMPLIFGADRAKLSKRHGATSVNDFKMNGYLPAAMVNYLSQLGWGHPKGKDKYSLNDLIDAFSIKKINTSPAIFDLNKLDHINSLYVKDLTDKDIADYINQPDIPLLNLFISAYRDRWSKLADAKNNLTMFDANYLDADTLIYLKNHHDLCQYIGALIRDDSPMQVILDQLLITYPAKDVKWVLRGLITGNVNGPNLDLLLPLYSRDLVLKRINSILMNQS